VECADKKKAYAMRLEFYKAREAVMADPDWKQEYEGPLNAREARVEDNNVVFDTKDNNHIGQALKRALEKEGLMPPTPPALNPHEGEGPA
jgi:hypothetical protein